MGRSREIWFELDVTTLDSKGAWVANREPRGDVGVDGEAGAASILLITERPDEDRVLHGAWSIYVSISPLHIHYKTPYVRHISRT